ncbi:chaperonin containing t-complex protein 1, delta subunit, tcpd, putative [Perkinsus marinus ATCC 50983]|uniref:Chaperonin containing t-complex protein 1, delta subunit, tcpd, putative n=1 Tax=Perkinsus marinus (strain ATCC 50983 / TXsc) TaxID=423536 RepID=C5KKP2_PERM5|nr:chaperonin containing t-complex protein 1, delta subunit, tcpd, putative [Perkinsus marinus ATCC 50983]EER15154.1 chaperonin containing t-complex protein 1, delta subunit, tcpd, putative [Perkinsus marinus ATCC 50983]|eukprot:XP_002783358.1 chaperonin containing t-complex protein 1, delta subunit, tcpd, putative [Perkinsus marinus ATCC 50983]
MSVMHHPTAAEMLIELSNKLAGDGSVVEINTTSVVVIADVAQNLLDCSIHPNTSSDGFVSASQKAEFILEDMSISISLDDRDSLITSIIRKPSGSNGSPGGGDTPVPFVELC